MTKRKTTRFPWHFLLIGAAVLILAAVWIWPTGVAPGSTAPAAVNQESDLISQRISVEEAYLKYQAGVFMLDVRTPGEWEQGHIPGATLIPLDQLASRADELPTDEEIVIYCRSGNRSAQALSLLTGAGFENIYSMDGGVNDWAAAGYEVVIGE